MEQFKRWISAQLETLGWEHTQPLQLNSLSGDAGFREYFRVSTTPPLLAVKAPVETENSRSFVSLAKHLRKNGVHAPQVVGVDYDQGWLLVEDFGDELLLSVLERDRESAQEQYGEALMSLLALQQCGPLEPPIPIYERELLWREMELFRQWFVISLLNYELSSDEHILLDAFFESVIASALSQPRVLVHRDFHSRNLIVRGSQSHGVIDFQDAVWGPVTYDLVSLLRDCYIRWSPEQVRRWACGYANMAIEVGVMKPVVQSTFQRWFDLMGVQRHIKVLGIFARLSLRDGKPSYLDDLPLVTRYIMEACEQHEECRPFLTWFKATILPKMTEQPWYQEVSKAGDSPTQ
ncbi:aminoglycoside phosphotransferase family protein [Marinibactrum halimedae]|uniref:Phosphotransferase n=1 Tax=Marinibactrum halimedae TaxID=1444977 RepID=A0AA37T1Y7_9GAMM|nr:phosphotransferase [Marinibactrum halimedae]MCD9459563.1 phosphotransferase [Marinibactrum halimedae]GLS25620.1 phosphotransferase [Marinibactrum halimedae]